jgi:hypothetical protein
MLQRTDRPTRANRLEATAARSRPPILLTVAIASFALILAACGEGSTANGAGPSPASFTAAAFRYAHCMRAQGLSSFPDPSMTDHNGQQVAYLATPSSLVASSAFKTASARRDVAWVRSRHA